MPAAAVGTIVKSTPARPATDTAYHSSYEGISYLGTPFEDGETSGVDGETFRNYCGDEDTVVLEDESGRVELEAAEGNKEVIDMLNAVPTGVVVAVEGVVGATGVMTVTQIQLPTLEPQDCAMDDDATDEAEILLISGLECGSADMATSIKREMLVDFLTGHISSNEGSKVARVVIAGGGCTKPIKPSNFSLFGNWNTSKQGKEKDIAMDGAVSISNTTLPIRELDLFLGELCSAGIPVDYIPGGADPTNANWPQKPLHPCLLPTSSTFVNLLSLSPNPYDVKMNGKLVIGSDGLNISDLRRYIAKPETVGDCDDVDDHGNPMKPTTTLKEMSMLESLEWSLKFNHIAPTAPDSIPTFPFKDVDPFVLNNTPHVYFAGNCDSFDSKLFEKDGNSTRLICVPSFSKTGQAVIVSLKSLSCRVVEFGVTADAASEMDDEKKMEG